MAMTIDARFLLIFVPHVPVFSFLSSFFADVDVQPVA
jgi:hypothetical protein